MSKLNALIADYRVELAVVNEDINLRNSYGGPDPSPETTAVQKQRAKWLQRSISDLEKVLETDDAN